MQLPAHLSQLILQTERLILREVNPEIIEYLYTQCSDEDIMSYKGFPTREWLEAEKEKQKGGFTTHRIRLKGFLIVLNETNETIGACHYHTWQPAHSRAEIGYGMYKDEYKNKGYMKEAVTAILHHGFEIMGLNRVEALVGPANEPSLRLVKSLGFTQEGILREHYCKDGELQDSIIFSLLKKEYKK
ncbi:MAG: GNAT family N-acetyltransferase [Flavipsychrobacter sp.]|nr:GNAT family N-acetyltransferase [Flavipsychrobacter sp.]